MVRQPRPAVEVGETVPSSSSSSSRRPLHEQRESHTNTLRIVPSTPPRFLSTNSVIDTTSHEYNTRDPVYGRSPLPTSSSHFLAPPVKTQDWEVQGSALESEVSRISLASIASGSTTSLETTHQPSRSATGSPSSRPGKSKKKLKVHPDNPHLFTLVTQDQDDDEATLSPTPRTLSTKSSYDFISSDAELRSSNSTVSGIPDPFSPNTVAYPTAPSSPALEDPVSSSPWNYRLGERTLRKVPKTPDIRSSKQKDIETSDSPLPPVPETSDDYSTHDLSSKPSFATTDSDNTNYKVYRGISPPQSEEALVPSSPSDSNWQVLGVDSSPAASLPAATSLTGSSPTGSVIHRPQTSENDESSTSYVTLNAPIRTEYSHESLVVPPLKPRSAKPNENFGYYKSRSRESLRTGSLTSISTVLSQQEASRAIPSSNSLVQLPAPTSSGESNSWAVTPTAARLMNEQPHQWSSQLSTIGSVSEGGTDRNSRSWSEGFGRRSTHSRQMLSISSSIAPDEEGRPRTNSLDPPQPAFVRRSRHNSDSSIRIVAEQDEYGDGITDMEPDLRTRPSRTRLSGFYSIGSMDAGRTSTMRSTASSRSNSLLASSMPTWAKIYYGSGERKALMPAGGSISSGTLDSRSNSFRSGSPSDHFPLSIYSPRRRPRDGEVQPGEDATRPSSLEIDRLRAPQSRPFRTSSIWSPHLRTDLASRAKRSLWEAPSTTGSTLGRNGSQKWLFALGFIFPFAWFIASFMKLPPNPMQDMQERDSSSANLGSGHDYETNFGSSDEKRYESASWWRRLNRYMSLVGILIIAVVIILAVIGLRENW
ncbi:serine-rich protein [Phlyctema vagabunda]|uniref:Serine-rich protein n=1 Tax=Phlyctema vagabunda TaxID=108571 RepID=A0ABR4PR05_9HELO